MRRARVRHQLSSDRNSRTGADRLLQQQQMVVQVLKDASLIAHEATSIEGAFQRIIDLICIETGWPVGHIYCPVADNNRELVSTPLWHLDQPQRFDFFRTLTDATRFTPDVGLIGRVMRTGAPLWSVDVTAEPQFIRIQPPDHINVRAFFAFPVLVGQEVAAVCEFFTTEVKEPDDVLLDVMSHIGMLLGQVIERARLMAANIRTNPLAFAMGETERAIRLTAVRDLAGALAHEINNPLFAARTSLALLMAERSLGMQSSQLLDVACTELDRIAEIMTHIQQLTQISKDGDGLQDLNRIVNEIMALAAILDVHWP